MSDSIQQPCPAKSFYGIVLKTACLAMLLFAGWKLETANNGFILENRRMHQEISGVETSIEATSVFLTQVNGQLGTNPIYRPLLEKHKVEGLVLTLQRLDNEAKVRP